MLIESCEANEGGAIFFENADVNSIVSGNLVIMSCNGIFGRAINVQDGKLYLDGECIISDNKANGSDNNICLSNNAVLVISPDFNGKNYSYYLRFYWYCY